MQVIADPQAPSHFFFIGLRAPIGGTGPRADRVGVVVLKQQVNADGSINNEPEILLTDAFLNPPNPPSGPVLLEADLAPIKPFLDAVVVPTAANDQTRFGTVQVNRGGVLSPVPPAPLNFGWASRVNPTPAPARVDRAGDDLINFVPTGSNLPLNFDNAFFNGREVAGVGPIGTGDIVVFTFMPNPTPPLHPLPYRPSSCKSRVPRTSGSSATARPSRRRSASSRSLTRSSSIGSQTRSS